MPSKDATPLYKYFAFISYNSKDVEWGRRVQRKLEHYRMPATLCSERGWQRTPIKPVFFAPTDIQPGGLNEELQERLRASRNLIVICSPHSARSEWVGREIAFFHQLGRTSHIHFFIVDGTPHSGHPDTECFNPACGELGLPEILGANIHERTQTYPFTTIPCPWLDKERAYVQLISKLLGVEFDAIWQRHRRQLFQRILAWSIGLLAVAASLLGVWLANQPVDVAMQLQESTTHNAALPPIRDAVVTLMLDNETKTDTIRTLGDSAVFANIPHLYINKEARVRVACRDFLPLDTTLVLVPSLTLRICRDAAVYGHVLFRLWNPTTEQPVSGVAVTVGGVSSTSGVDGTVDLSIPLSAQLQAYAVTAAVPLMQDSLYMPCGADDVILTQ